MALLHLLELLLSAHHFWFRENHDVSNMGLVFIEGAIELSGGVLSLELLGLVGKLNMAHGADLHALELELQSHHC